MCDLEDLQRLDLFSLAYAASTLTCSRLYGRILGEKGQVTKIFPQVKHLCHCYADHLVIDESCSYFAQAYTLIQTVASSSSKLLLYVTFWHKWSFK